MDKSKKYLSDTECFFALNHDKGLDAQKSNSGKTVQLPANYPACEIEQPAGENYTIGTYKSPITNEEYSWVFNSNGVHYIQRISSEKGCEIVYTGCLKLNADPKHSIEQFRAYLKVDKTCKNQHGKQLIWVDGTDTPIGQLDVEASINTDSFSTPFFEQCSDPCELIQMYVPKPCGCIRAEYLPPSADDIHKTNNLLNRGFKFIYRHVYYDGRASEWSDPSGLYFQDTKSGCFDTVNNLSRCMRLRIPMGNPLVEKIEIAYSTGETDESMQAIWNLTDTVNKYNPYTSAQQFWYERELSPEITNSLDDNCTFQYIFCNDKQCEPLDPREVSRTYNPIPRKPQGLLPIKNALGFYNYEQGNCPIEKSEIQKLNISLDCDSLSNDCNTDFVTVTVRAVIHNRAFNRNQFVYRMGGQVTNQKDDISDTAFFGGMDRNDGDQGLTQQSQFVGGSIAYDQYFRNETRNFIVYVEGTDIWGEMKQWKAKPSFTDLQQWGTIAQIDDVHVRNRWKRAASRGEYFYQECVLKVPKGTRGFLRLASHHASGNQQDTSTFVIGLTDLKNYRGDSMNLLTADEEIYFDTCNGNVDLMTSFVIDDNAVDKLLSKPASAYYGYIKDATGRPVEGLILYESPSSILSTTDHNGFFHFYFEQGRDDPFTLNIAGETSAAGYGLLKSFSCIGEGGSNTENSERILDSDNVNYKKDFYSLVRVNVRDCDNSPLSGIRVAISGSKYAVSQNGVVEFKIRNNQNGSRRVRVVAINFNNCFKEDCMGNCSPCMPTSTAVPATSFAGKPVLNVPELVMNTSSLTSHLKGLKAGGRFAFGFVLEGDGWISAVNEVDYIDIPRTQEVGKQLFCKLKYSAVGMNLPKDTRCLKIVRTENLNPFELQWIVDKIERTSDKKIKLTIQSLNDYNAKYNFRTNTVYQYLKDDRVEFIYNGDRTVFQNGTLNYLTLSPFHDKTESSFEEGDEIPVDYFNQLLIEDDGRLDDLLEGAVIELQRPKRCGTTNIYFSICTSIDVVDGALEQEVGTFETFDTYIVNRVIGNHQSVSFEHHSPSDFWGDRLSDIGRPYVVNEYENEKRFGRNLSINSPNQFNRFGDVVKKFDAPEQGDLIAMGILDGKVILAIGENDNFLAQVSDDLLRVGGDGIIRAASADSIVSDAQPKISGQFGCQYSHIGSIHFGDSFARWVDVNRHADVKHDYNQAKDVSEGRMQSYFRRRCQEIETHNRSVSNPLDKFRFTNGLNHHTGVLNLTIKTLRHGAINNEKEAYLKPNETLMYHPLEDDYRGFASFTPEAYSHLDLFDGKGCAFVSYFGGVPYIHPILADKWNEFYGVAVDEVFGVALNKFPEKIKRGLAIEVQSTSMYYVHDVSTEMSNFRSEIPPIRWKRREDKWNAEFLCNKNGRGGLYSGAVTRGYFISVTFVRDNTSGLVYGSTDNDKRTKFSELDMILFKFLLSESSGFTENV